MNSLRALVHDGRTDGWTDGRPLVYLSVRPSIRPSVCLSVRPSVRLSVGLSVSARARVWVDVCNASTAGLLQDSPAFLSAVGDQWDQSTPL